MKKRARKLDTLILSCFPGTGKTWLTEHTAEWQMTAVDCESSRFPKEDFPANYIRYVESLIGTVDVILVSSHKEVRDALHSKGIKFLVVTPLASAKEGYLLRYKDRGSDEAFVQLIDQHWTEWLLSMNEDSSPTLHLEDWEYLSDRIFDKRQSTKRHRRNLLNQWLLPLYEAAVLMWASVVFWKGDLAAAFGLVWGLALAIAFYDIVHAFRQRDIRRKYE
jgi:hypothetical protein